MISAGMELFLVSRNLERVADLATNIAGGRGVPGGREVDQASRRRPGRRGLASGVPRSVKRSPPAARERLAAIDVGSNSIRLLVATYDPAAGLVPIDEIKDQPRLAKGLAATGRLDEDAMERALTALRRMADVCRRRGVTRIAAVATAAVREAKNGAEFVRRVREDVGLPLRIINTEDEAQLSYRSVSAPFPARRHQGDRRRHRRRQPGAGRRRGRTGRAEPLPAARRRAPHRAVPPWDKPPRREVGSLRKHLAKRLTRQLPKRAWTGATVIGSGGTFTNLGRMVRRAPGRRSLGAGPRHRGDRRRGRAGAGMAGCTAPRCSGATVPGLNPERARHHPGRAGGRRRAARAARRRQLTVSAYGLREGLLWRCSARERPPLHRWTRCGWSASSPIAAGPTAGTSSRCAASRSRSIDQIGDAMGCTPEERHILEAAGDPARRRAAGELPRHHRTATNSSCTPTGSGSAPRERGLVALVSRYHRKSGPRKSHPEFAALSPDDRALVLRTSGLLRVADGLDRGHTAVVEEVVAELTRKKLVVRIEPRRSGANMELEGWAARRKSDVLRKVLGRKVTITASLASPRKPRGEVERRAHPRTALRRS